MLATIREYARERLEGSGEADAIRRRHAEAYLALAEEAAPNILGPEGRAWTGRLEADHDDLRAALDWIVRADEAELGLRLIAALWRFWQMRGHLREGHDRAEAVLALPLVPEQRPGLRSRAEGAAGGIAYWRLDSPTTYRRYAAALEHARETDDLPLIADSLYDMGFVAGGPDVDGIERYRAGAPIFEEALAAYRALGDRGGEASALWALHQSAQAAGDHATSEQLAVQTLGIARELHDPFRIGWAAFTLAIARLVGERYQEAGALFGESLGVFTAAQDRTGILMNVAAISQVVMRTGDEAVAWRLVGAADRMKDEIGVGLLDEALSVEGFSFRIRPETIQEEREFAAGHTLSDETAVELARDAARAVAAQE
jgi:tetratricopeptide (TPR) repeat protein